MKHAILTVIGKDRPGIIAKVTGILYQKRCNLEDVSMTILEGEFAMILVLSHRFRNFGVLARELQQKAKSFGLSIFGKDVKEKLQRGEKHLRGSEPFLISVIGKDRTGIVHETTNLLARQGLNVTDLNSKILGYGKRALYAMMLEVDIPKRFKIAKLERSLKALSKKLRMEFRLKRVERVAP